MKVIFISLLLTSSLLAQACKTCYYYEQAGINRYQNEECIHYQERHSACDQNSQHCGSDTVTTELEEDYYDNGYNYTIGQS